MQLRFKMLHSGRKCYQDRVTLDYGRKCHESRNVINVEGRKRVLKP